MDEATLFRVQKEREELEIKIRKLNEFLNCKEYDVLLAEEQDLMREQLWTMQTYHNLLCRRIFLIPMPSPQVNIDDFKYDGMK